MDLPNLILRALKNSQYLIAKMGNDFSRKFPIYHFFILNTLKYLCVYTNNLFHAVDMGIALLKSLKRGINIPLIDIYGGILLYDNNNTHLFSYNIENCILPMNDTFTKHDRDDNFDNMDPEMLSNIIRQVS